MQAIFDFFRSIFTSINNLGLPLYLSICLVGFSFTGTQVLKTPYKMLTSRIPNEALRHKVNLVIWLIPVLLGVLGMFIVSRFEPYADVFNFGGGAIIGFASESLYELVSKLFKRVKDGEDVTVEAIQEDVAATTRDVAKAQKDFDKMIEAMKKNNAKSNKVEGK